MKTNNTHTKPIGIHILPKSSVELSGKIQLQYNRYIYLRSGWTIVFTPFIFSPSTAFSTARMRLSFTAT